MSQGVYRWRLSGIGEQGNDYLVTLWRHGRASAGEPSTLTRTKRFNSESERANYLDSLFGNERNERNDNNEENEGT